MLGVQRYLNEVRRKTSAGSNDMTWYKHFRGKKFSLPADYKRNFISAASNRFPDLYTLFITGKCLREWEY